MSRCDYMVISKELLEILACPKCKNDLEEKEDKLFCKKCKIGFTLEDNVPDLLSEK